MKSDDPNFNLQRSIKLKDFFSKPAEEFNKIMGIILAKHNI